MSALPFAQVVLAIPVDRAFTYRVPDEMSPRLVPGMRVRVPFRNRKEIGWCVERCADSPVAEPKSIAALLDDGPVADSGMLSLTRWIAEYYRCSWGEALEAAVPSVVLGSAEGRRQRVVELAVPVEEARAYAEGLPPHRAKLRRTLLTRIEVAGALTAKELARHAGTGDSSVSTLVNQGMLRRVDLPPGPDPYASFPVKVDSPPEPNPDQEQALARIGQAVAASAFEVFLLFGITGSGKTEVYLRAIHAAVELGRQAIVLVPEISLTPQTVARFRARFARVAVLHSGLAPAHRAREWGRLRRGEADVVVGPRSAVFAPVPRLGLIVVDEEHETGYKQESVPRYHARDVAVVRARQEGAPVVLGSATPSLESWHNAVSGKYSLLRLPRRVAGAALPRVEVVDMTAEATPSALPVISRTLDVLIRNALARGEQAILFLNRRGFSTLILCPSCKSAIRCERCSVALTWHRARGRAECHYCREDRVPPERCPECSRPGLRYMGVGTEKVEEVIAKLYPGFRTARMDGDTMRGRDAHARLLADLHEGEVDLLVGTQMVAKGHDVPNVTLVGVISADTCLQLKDFRSAERTFQLVAQVAGRAGRGGSPGRVVVQTYNPGHYAIRFACAHDFEGFAQRELELRRQLRYPPFGRLLRVLVEGDPESCVKQCAEEIRKSFDAELTGKGLEFLGPAAAPIARIDQRWRWHILVKGQKPSQLREAAVLVEGKFKGGKTWRVTLDVDPMSML